MPVYACPKGHQSTESDFCSECGSKIQGAPSSAPEPSTAGGMIATQPGPPCPDCGAPRMDLSTKFCEVCGYNFNTGARGNVVPEPEPAPAVPAKQWSVTVAIDPSLREADSPEPPADVPERTVALDKPVNLIGRKSDKRAIHPEISLDLDDAVSHRHALLTAGDDGSMILRDLGSSNGTRVNGTDVKALEDVAIHEGDQITLGRWTRLTVKAV
jgi:hypothetical protein